MKSIIKIIFFGTLILIIYNRKKTDYFFEKAGRGELQSALDSIIDTLKNIIARPVINTLDKGFKKVGNLVFKPIKEASNTFKTQASVFHDKVLKIFENIFDKIKGLFTKMKIEIHNVINNIKLSIKDIIDIIINGFKLRLEDIGNVIESASMICINSIKPFTTKIPSTIDKYINKFKKQNNKINTTIKKAVEELITALSNIFEFIKTLLDTLLRGVGNMLNIVIKFFTFLLESIINPIIYGMKYLTIFFNILKDPDFFIDKLSDIYSKISDYIETEYYTSYKEYVEYIFPTKN